MGAYILKASLATPTIPQKNMKMAKNGPNMTPNGLKWPKTAKKLPKITPKWPKNDARIYALFPNFFLTEEAVPQTFSLLECMGPTLRGKLNVKIDPPLVLV